MQEKEQLPAQIEDAIRLARGGSGARFVGFLDEQQAAQAVKLAQTARFSAYLLWGGYPQAERVCFGAFPDWMEPEPAAFPVQVYTAAFRTCDALSHRDFLGALLATGIARKQIGDILPEAGRCVFFLRREIGPFVTGQLTKVGRVGIRLSEGAQQPLPPAHRYESFSATVASARLDCVTAACAGISREKARNLMLSGMVQVNHQPAADADFPVREGALLSIRGWGRYRIDALNTHTKKGRLHLEGRKYI